MNPIKVDAFTGYRYYSQQQLNTMLLIKRLKRYGFSLEEIRKLLDCNDKRALFSTLQKQKEQLKQQVQKTNQIIQEISSHLQNFERTGDIMSYQKGYEVELRQVPARAVLTCRQKMSVDEFGKYTVPYMKEFPKKK